jgi:predicted TIM-barrel fold metal-dependent hydrolase
MFASNFPVSSLRVDYDTLVTSVAQMIEGYTPAQQRGFFVDNAARFYRLQV